MTVFWILVAIHAAGRIFYSRRILTLLFDGSVFRWIREYGVSPVAGVSIIIGATVLCIFGWPILAPAMMIADRRAKFKEAERVLTDWPEDKR